MLHRLLHEGKCFHLRSGGPAGNLSRRDHDYKHRPDNDRKTAHHNYGNYNSLNGEKGPALVRLDQALQQEVQAVDAFSLDHRLDRVKPFTRFEGIWS